MAPSPLILVVAAASFLAVALSHLDDHWSGPGYGYTPGSWDGPENWGKLSPKYRLCGEGKKQSPINIVTAQAIPNPNLDTLARVYAASNATLINTGKDITMTFPDNQQAPFSLFLPFQFRSKYFRNTDKFKIHFNGWNFIQFHLAIWSK